MWSVPRSYNAPPPPPPPNTRQVHEIQSLAVPNKSKAFLLGKRRLGIRTDYYHITAWSTTQRCRYKRVRLTFIGRVYLFAIQIQLQILIQRLAGNGIARSHKEKGYSYQHVHQEGRHFVRGATRDERVRYAVAFFAERSFATTTLLRQVGVTTYTVVLCISCFCYIKKSSYTLNEGGYYQSLMML